MKFFLLIFLLFTACAGTEKTPPVYNDAPLVLKNASTQGDVLKPVTVLTLPTAVSRSIMKNPHLDVAKAEIEALQIASKVEGAPQPLKVSVEFEDFLGSGAYRNISGSQLTISLSYVLETGAKRFKRAKTANLNVNAARAAHDIMVLQTAGETAQAFLKVLYLQEKLRMLDEQKSLSAKILEKLELKVKGGKLADIQLDIPRAGLKIIEIEKKRFQNRYELSKKALAYHWGSRTPDFKSVAGNWDLPKIKTLQQDFIKSVKTNPHVKKWIVAVEIAKSQLDSAKAGSYPDIEISAGYRYFRDNNDSAAVLGISVPFNISSVNRHKVDFAQALKKKARREIIAAEFKLETEIIELYQELVIMHSTISDYKNNVIRLLIGNLKGIEEGFNLGKFTHLELLASQKAILEIREKILDELYEYHRRAVELEYKSGVSLYR
ncbi:TolC family protein [Myxococcota bacterium]|nr:TolC family protein [Myxococcota bacterium]MBU1380361.1 TolC family protein [Myxococcota bacterium]MBU1498199.1 TolC family protein [Myxococcota bacterium]